MTRACHAPIRAATGDAFTDEEINDIVDRLAKRYARAKGKTPGLEDRAAMAEAAGEMTKDAVEGALQMRRLQLAAKRAKVARERRLDIMPGDEAENLRAYNVGDETQGAFTGSSVEAEGRARSTALWGDVERGLAQREGLSNRLVDFFGGGDRDLEDNIAKEMSRLTGGRVDPTGDEDALHAAQVFTAALEKNRLAQNAEGAFIPKLEGRISAQSHDRLKVSGGFWREMKVAGLKAIGKEGWSEASQLAGRKAFREWRDFIRPRLDPKTFEGLDLDGELDFPKGEIKGDDQKAAWLAAKSHREESMQLAALGVIDSADDPTERFLYHAWMNIVTGASETLGGASDLAAFKPPASVARSVSKHRVLHFSSPDAWMEYHRQYGRGSLYAVVMGELDRGGRNAALMARWGPAPQAAYDNEVSRLISRARTRGDDRVVKRLMSGMRRAEFDEITGEGSRPDSLRLALVGRSIRTSQVLAKLGGMVLSSLSDTVLTSNAMARAGMTLGEGYSAAFKGITRMQSEEGKAAADLLDVGARSAAAHLSGRFQPSDGPLGWSAWAQRVFYKVNGFELWSEGLRRGVGEMLSAHWGAEAAKGWSDLQVGTRETFERYGVDAQTWNLVRSKVQVMGDGRTYFGLDIIDQLDHAEIARWAGLPGKKATVSAVERARNELRLRFQTMTGGILDDAMTEARARERVGLTRGLKPGTVWGEAVRVFTQFWSFNQAVMGRHVVPAARGFAGRQPVALLANIIIGSTLMGLLTIQAKQITRGRAPRPLDNPGLWPAALLQGGGLGIYGDFLFGEYNRAGLPATITTFGGPAVSELERLYQIVGAAAGTLNPMASPAQRDKARFKLENQGFRFVRDNMPFGNVWYTRLALDYLILWRIQEAISPGYLRRYENNAREREGSDFLVSPAETVGA